MKNQKLKFKTAKGETRHSEMEIKQMTSSFLGHIKMPFFRDNAFDNFRKPKSKSRLKRKHSRKQRINNRRA